jgi:trans-aconitate methyltransferase
MTHSAQTWNASEYAKHGRFVADMAAPLVALLNPQPGERILDAGCGDGALTARIAVSGADVLGVDGSAAMVAAARALAQTTASSFSVEQHDLTELVYANRFDAIFSNAALHWIPAALQPKLLSALFRSLRPGGRLVAEMGGQGNIAAIRVALAATCEPYGLDAEAKAASFYPSSLHYKQMLEDSGFHVQSIDLIPRPTPLPDRAKGMATWLNTFRNGILDLLPADARTTVLEQTIALLRPALSDPAQDGAWTADYVRLRFQATRPGNASRITWVDTQI